jgi:hypothetical protein
MVMSRYFPWNYDVGEKIESGRKITRLWEPDLLGRLAAEELFLKSWRKQQKRESFLGRRFMRWMRNTANFHVYPTQQ